MVVRRMDGLARLVHSRTDDMRRGARIPVVVTAVAFVAGSKPDQLTLAIAHNAEDARQYADDKARLRIVRDAVIGNSSVTDAAHVLVSTCGLRGGRIPDGQLGHLDRLIRDLDKLRASYEGKYDSRPGGAEFKNALHDFFGRYLKEYLACQKEALCGAPLPPNTALNVSQLAWPAMMIEVGVTAPSSLKSAKRTVQHPTGLTRGSMASVVFAFGLKDEPTFTKRS
ncbi:hypothetical protein WJ69_34140 [Burkholderia ubonensis]|nr:hypothetical protein WJ69_34140 [Burkholderia ubonensis]